MGKLKVFNELWREYDLWYEKNPIKTLNELKLVKSMVSKKPCLEVGVGTGFFASNVSCGFGVDPSIGMLRKARERGVDVVQGVGEFLPFRESCFNTVLIVVTVCFMKDPLKGLVEAHRVLRMGGEVIACIVPKDSSWGKLYEEEKRRGHPFYKYATFYTIKEITYMMRKAGFEVKELKGVLGFKPDEEPFEEEPSSNILGKGFICIKGSK